MKNPNTDNQAIEDGKKVTIEGMTRAEVTEEVIAVRKQAKDKGLKAIGGFIIYDYRKEDEGEKAFAATLKIIDPTNI